MESRIFESYSWHRCITLLLSYTDNSLWGKEEESAPLRPAKYKYTDCDGNHRTYTWEDGAVIGHDIRRWQANKLLLGLWSFRMKVYVLKRIHLCSCSPGWFCPRHQRRPLGLTVGRTHNEVLHPRAAATSPVCQFIRRPEKFSNLASKLKSLLEMTGKPDEIVLSIGKQNCNQTNMISSWSDRANASRDMGKCI